MMKTPGKQGLSKYPNSLGKEGIEINRPLNGEMFGRSRSFHGQSISIAPVPPFSWRSDRAPKRHNRGELGQLKSMALKTAKCQYMTWHSIIHPPSQKNLDSCTQTHHLLQLSFATNSQSSFFFGRACNDFSVRTLLLLLCLESGDSHI